MTLEQLLDSLPHYAVDLKRNLNLCLRQPELNEQQIWGAVVASALASRNPSLTAAVLDSAARKLTPTAIESAQTAAAMMAMSNIYFRFQHTVEHEEYAAIPSRLRMNAVRTHTVPPLDYELFCIAASAIHGCSACIRKHEQSARAKGASEAAILACVRIAAVVHALATATA